MFAALGHRNFRLLWTGQLVSLTGTMMQNAAVLWHVSLLAGEHDKGVALGLVGLVRVVPIVLFSLVGGVVADAGDRRRMMLVTQSLMALVATTLAIVTLSGSQALWPVYLLTALGSAAMAFDAPARQSLMPMLVPPAHLPNAISLSTIMMQTAAVVGPTLAGLVIGVGGVGWAYVLNALSFLAVLGGLVRMRDLPERPAGERTAISLGSAREGLAFVFSSPLLRGAMLLDFFACFFASATALLPMFAQDVLHVGPTGYGWLYAAASIGAVATSAVMVRSIEKIEARGRVLLLSVAGYGAATIVFGLSHSFWLSFAALAATGATDTVSMVLRNVIRQTHTPDRLRGRMTSVNMIFFMGGPQLGELEAGLVAQWAGPVASVVTGGVGALAALGLVAWWTPALGRYRRELIPRA